MCNILYVIVEKCQLSYVMYTKLATLLTRESPPGLISFHCFY